MLFETLANGLIVGAANSLIALGFTMVYGMLRLINFSHGDTYTVGAVVGLLIAQRLGLNYWLCVLGAGLACGVLGLVLERIGFRPLRHRPVGAMITSIGLSTFISNFIAMVWGTQPQFFETPYVSRVIRFGALGFAFQRVLVFAVSLLLLAVLYGFIRLGYTGKVIRAVSQDMETSWLMGIRPNYAISLVFLIGGCLAGVAGALVSPLEVVMPFMGASVGLKSFAIVVLGGLGNIEGTILAGFLVGLIQSLTATYVSSAYADSVVFLLLLLVLLVRPTGIVAEGGENV